MAIQEIRKLNDTRPFRPFDIHTAEGRSIRVAHPQFIAKAPAARTVVVSRPLWSGPLARSEKPVHRRRDLVKVGGMTNLEMTQEGASLREVVSYRNSMMERAVNSCQIVL